MPPSKKWEPAAEMDLCMAIILTGGSTASYKWPEIHTIMCQLGHGFTKDAISQHFTKTILRAFKARHGLGAGKLPSTMSPAATAAGSKKKPLREEDGPAAAGSPAKKQRRSQKQKTGVKAEAEAEAEAEAAMPLTHHRANLNDILLAKFRSLESKYFSQYRHIA
ncbi:hypothetical protein E4U54_000581 [Claviceps lovelessii]|nr:hypothetical protein E4U54_000581 [Claviceps lovelessii]